MESVFFLDAGMGFWEEWSAPDPGKDFAEMRCVDYGKLFGLEGETIKSVNCTADVDARTLSRFSVEFASGAQLILKYADPNNMESGTELIFL